MSDVLHSAKRAAKRVLDIAGSSVLLAVLSPLLLTTAIVIRMDSKGPVIFKQQRIGLNGAPFTFYKFRSMYPDVDPSRHKEYVQSFIVNGTGPSTLTNGGTKIYKLTDDDRVTRVGRFIRKTSIDELPQLFNVLKGEMSLVGPRPPLPYESEVYTETHKKRLTVMPGITGLWQVSGRNELTFDDMIELDLAYVDGWSMWLDLKILLKTVRVVLFNTGGAW